MCVGFVLRLLSSWHERLVAIRNDKRGLEDDERLRWIDEVKVLKAFYHLWLLQMYGPIPIVDKNIKVGSNSEETYVTRKSIDEIVTYLTSLLDEVIESNNLPGLINYVYTESGRITMPAAKAIKAKILVLAASPIFNGNKDLGQLFDKDGIKRHKIFLIIIKQYKALSFSWRSMTN